jgi:hypothetical protein
MRKKGPDKQVKARFEEVLCGPWHYRADYATKLATSGLTAAEHAKFIERGGFRWLKRMLANLPIYQLP